MQQAAVDFVIVTALEEERDHLFAKLPGWRRLPPSTADVRVYYAASLAANLADGSPCVYDIVVAPLLGMGRVEAANTTNDAIRSFRPRYVLLVGVAGGAAERDVALGDVLVAEQIVDYELQKLSGAGSQVRWQVYRSDPRLLGAAKALSDAQWQQRLELARPEPRSARSHVGPMASGDKVTANEAFLLQLSAHWPALIGIEMEAGGVASACAQAVQPPGFLMIRGVSDLADDAKGTHGVKAWRACAGEAAAAYVIELLRRGPVPPRDSAGSLVHGIGALPTDYSHRVKNFLTEYFGTPDHPVPFGGRSDDLTELDAWLDDDSAPPYLLVAAPAGRGKSALLSRWSAQLLGRQDVALAFLPVSVRFRTNLAGVVFASLVARLAALHGAAVQATVNAPVEVWRGLMGQYLQQPLDGERRILMILDGLDEAADWEASADLFPLDPPKWLRVVVSTRIRAGEADGTSWLRDLGWERKDLARMCVLAPLPLWGVADVLKRMGVPLDELGTRIDIVAALHRLSEGDPLLVRLYVEDIWRRGQTATRLRPEDLDAIQPGLAGFFARWWEDQHRLWGSERPLRERSTQTLLNLLACALAPLGRDDLLQLAPEDTGLNTWTLDDSLRTLTRFIIGDGGEMGYVFSHPRLSAFFLEKLSKKDRREWEERFLAWGRDVLDGLSVTRIRPENAAPYIVQCYGAHLERAKGEPREVFALVSDGWRRAWEAYEGSCAGFLNDVERAWKVAAQVDQRQFDAGQHAPYLDQEVQFALCHASVNSLAHNIAPALIGALVEYRIWNGAQGLAFALRAPELSRRVEAIALLAPYLHRRQLDLALTEALEAACSIKDCMNRASAIESLAPMLPEASLPAVFRVVQAITDDRARCVALSSLVPRLPTALLSEAVAMASGIEILWARANMLILLGPRLPPALLAEARRAATTIPDHVERTRACEALGGALVPPQPIGANDVSWIPPRMTFLPGMHAHSDPMKELLARVRAADEGERGALLRNALADARAITDSWEQVVALVALAPHLPETLLRVICKSALAHDTRQENLSMVLNRLAPHLPDALLREIMTEVMRRPTDFSSAFGSLVPHAPVATLAWALDTIRAIPKVEDRGSLLADLAPSLPEALLPEALEIAKSLSQGRGLAEAMRQIPRRLPEGYLSEAVDLTLTMKETPWMLEILRGFASRLSIQLLEHIRRAVLMNDKAAHKRAIIELLDANTNRLVEASPQTMRMVHRHDYTSDADPLPLTADDLEQLLHRHVYTSDVTPPPPPPTADDPQQVPQSRQRVTAIQATLRGFMSLTRPKAMEVIEGLAPLLVSTGGDAVAARVAQAILNVGMWWP